MLYYNDFDANACAWMRELIDRGELPEGKIDERSILEVRPEDLAGYDQCHFFAGIGGWPLAFRLAGWSAAGSVWSASLPCQPFSDAGKRKGYADERHLWPVFYGLVAECRPSVLVGEQVASKAGREWLDNVKSDLNILGYDFAAADICAAAVGAPHIRQRLYWCAIFDNAKERLHKREHESDYLRSELRSRGMGCGSTEEDGGVHKIDVFSRTFDNQSPEETRGDSATAIPNQTEGVDTTERNADTGMAGIGAPHIRQRLYWCAGRVGDSSSQRRQQVSGSASGDEKTYGRARRDRSEQNGCHLAPGAGQDGRAADNSSKGLEGRQKQSARQECRASERGCHAGWSDVVWLPCLDGKWRPVPRRLADSGYKRDRKNTGSVEESKRKPQTKRTQPAHATEYCSNDDRVADGDRRRCMGTEHTGISVEGAQKAQSRRDCADGDGNGTPRSGTDRLWHEAQTDAGSAQPSPAPLADWLSPLLVRGSGVGVPEDEIDPDATTEARVMRLKGYGNAIVPQLAAIFLESVREAF